MKRLHLLAALWLTMASGFAADTSPDLVVHEWGTFTSVQGGDGGLLPWQPFLTPDLPKFVYDWQRPGFGHESPMLFTKGGIRSLQRMETPVIYFYTDRERTADVTVKFPTGFITEWYPLAQQVGSINRNPLAAGTNPMVLNPAFTNSLIAWRNLHLLPASSSGLATQLPTDNSGNHYFAARETDSAFVRVATGGTNGATPELEKLLFYRGTGNFGTPLKVTMTEAGLLSVTNTGAQPLAGLFLVEMRNGTGHWTELGKLSRGQSKGGLELAALEKLKPVSLETFSKRLGDRMKQGLVQAGLYPREAAAMVKTWSKSWFAEEGVRVLYILPREWTDETLPITINPQPKTLARVMVGRAEIITPELQKELAGEISKSQSGDQVADQRIQEISSRLGRFFNPAYQLARQRLPAARNKPVAAVRFE